VYRLRTDPTDSAGLQAPQRDRLIPPRDKAILSIVRSHLVSQLALALILSLASGASPLECERIEILHKGCFHGDEVPEESAGTWDALYRQGPGFVLVSRTVQVRPCRDAITDEPGQKTGREVVVDAEGVPILLVRGLQRVGAQPVPIRTAYPGREPSELPSGGGYKYIAPGNSLQLLLGTTEYRLSARGRNDPTRPDYDRLVLDYRLTLTGPDGKSQDLPAPDRFAEDGVPTLLWAGDLDQDGKLDLYMDTTNHYNLGNHVLLVSSHATPGQLVRLVASRRYVGC
jgi:hypothetical protein